LLAPPSTFRILGKLLKSTPHTTHHTQDLVHFVGTGFFDFLRQKRMVRRPPEDRAAVVSWYKQGLTPAEICRQTGFDHHFVTRWISRYNDSGSLDDAERAGRPRKLSTRVERTVERKMRGKKRRSSRVIARELKKQKVAEVSYRTVQRTVHRRGLHAFKQRKTSRLSEAHKRGRLKFAKTASKRNWSNVVFSDEHTFKQFKGGNPRHRFVWAKSPSEVPGKEMERWGLAVDTWAGFSSRGKTKLAFYEGTLNANRYQDVLESTLLPDAQEWFDEEKEGWELQQDKATCHSAKSTKRWLEEHGVAVVEGWPTKGDDINPMENLWAILDDRLESKKFKTEQGMKKAIRQLWDDIDSSLLNNLIHSIPDRLRRIRKAKGGSIKAVN
jgi:transposase